MSEVVGFGAYLLTRVRPGDSGAWCCSKVGVGHYLGVNLVRLIVSGVVLFVWVEGRNLRCSFGVRHIPLNVILSLYLRDSSVELSAISFDSTNKLVKAYIHRSSSRKVGIK